MYVISPVTVTARHVSKPGPNQVQIVPAAMRKTLGAMESGEFAV